MTTSTPGGKLTSLITPHFLVAVVLLVASAGLAGPFARFMQFKANKKSLALKEPLYNLDVRKLGPYRIAKDRTGEEQRHVLLPEMVEALGTDQYISWNLEDTSLPPNDPLRRANLFVTYYSGGADLVPHTPDVCFLGSGYEPAQQHQNLVANVRGLGATSADVPIRVCTFLKTAVFKHRKQTVLYTFHCNGRFTGTRSGVRLLINDPRTTHAYFSKVEIRFPAATRSQSTEGVAKLLGHVLPVLIEDHFPDFEKAEAASK